MTVMARHYSGTEQPVDDVVIFKGREIEHTPAYGHHTLFVVGNKVPVSSIKELLTLHGCPHLFLGANWSFQPNSIKEWNTWVSFLMDCLEEVPLVWLTLDMLVPAAETLRDARPALFEDARFIPLIRVPISRAEHFGPNAVLKIDDVSIVSPTNPGVWCNPMEDVLNPACLTRWANYKRDVSLWTTKGPTNAKPK